MTNGKIEVHERVKTDHKVEITAGPHRRGGTKEHIVVGDIISFAKALEDAGADPWDQVRVTLVPNGVYLAQTMGVYWTEDTTNGQPTPQAEPAEEKLPPQDKSLGPITGRTG